MTCITNIGLRAQQAYLDYCNALFVLLIQRLLALQTWQAISLTDEYVEGPQRSWLPP